MTTQTPIKEESKKTFALSRLGRKPVEIPQGVQVKVDGSTVTAEGKRGKLSWALPQGIGAKVEGAQVKVMPLEESKALKPLHGLSRKLVLNLIEGVTTGFLKRLVIEGVGFKAVIAGDKLTLTLGFSHPVHFKIPKDVKVIVDPKISNVLIIEGNDKQRVGEIAAQIRSIKKPEPYKGTGIRYENEIIKRKAGKAVAGAGAGGSGGGKK